MQVVLRDHLVLLMTHFSPDGSGLFQKDNAFINKSQMAIIRNTKLRNILLARRPVSLEHILRLKESVQGCIKAYALYCFFLYFVTCLH